LQERPQDLRLTFSLIETKWTHTNIYHAVLLYWYLLVEYLLQDCSKLTWVCMLIQRRDVMRRQYRDVNAWMAIRLYTKSR